MPKGNKKKKKQAIDPGRELPKDSRANPPVKSIRTPVSLSFRHADVGGTFCLSKCETKDVKEVVDCLRQLTTLDWWQVLQQGGKPGQKVGLGYTAYDDGDLKGAKRPPQISPDVQIAGVRASQRCRVFGAYVDYVLWFDRDHEIVPQKET